MDCLRSSQSRPSPGGASDEPPLPQGLAALLPTLFLEKHHLLGKPGRELDGDHQKYCCRQEGYLLKINLKIRFPASILNKCCRAADNLSNR
jgi:hypothetical protein